MTWPETSRSSTPTMDTCRSCWTSGGCISGAKTQVLPLKGNKITNIVGSKVKIVSINVIHSGLLKTLTLQTRGVPYIQQYLINDRGLYPIMSSMLSLKRSAPGTETNPLYMIFADWAFIKNSSGWYQISFYWAVIIDFFKFPSEPVRKTYFVCLLLWFTSYSLVIVAELNVYFWTVWSDLPFKLFAGCI